MKTFLKILFSLILLSSTAFAQGGMLIIDDSNGPDDALEIDLAGTREVQYGTYVAPCGCTFQPSAGWGSIGDIRYLFGNRWDRSGVSVAGGVHYMRYTSYEEPENQDSSDLATIGMTYLTIEPSLQYGFGPHAFLRLGANVGFLVNNTYHHETHPVPDPEEDVDSSMGDLRTIRIAASLAFGYAIRVSNAIELEPTVGVEYPFNVIRKENASNWRVVTYLASIGIRFRT